MAAHKSFAEGEVLTARDINEGLNPTTADHIPYAVASGVVTIPGSSSAGNSTTPVVLPAGRFTQPPVVIATARNSNYSAYTGTPTTEQVTVGSRRLDGVSSVVSHSVAWVAIQMRDSSGEG